MNQETKKITVDQYDTRAIYCRMLGHELTFKYCRSTADGRFCPRIFDCWHDKIEVGRYIKSFFSDDEISAIIRPPKPKIHTLINLISNTGQGG